jgi:ATP-dependent Clp protease, protease subunit
MSKREDSHSDGKNWSPLDETMFKNRIVQVSGSVDDKLAYRVNKEILGMAFEDSKKPIYLFINSPGGEITSGFSIYDTARFVDCPLYTVVTGLAASMGSLIALCAKKENRLAFPNSRFLIHQPLIAGQLFGSASDLEIHAQDIVDMKAKINRLYATETGRSLDDVVKATDRDKWMDATQAQSFGLISKVISKTAELPK